MRLIGTLAGGPDGLRAFLTAPQPDMDERFGAELLQESPDELLAALERRLSEIEKTATDFGEIDQAAADPIHDHRPQSAPGHRVNRVLGILDQLDKENSSRRFID